MPIRPFYVRAQMRDSHGREIGLGPSGRETGMDITITQRNKGAIEPAFHIGSYTYTEGDILKLRTIVYDCNGLKVAERITEY